MLLRYLSQGRVQTRLEPFAGAHFALITEAVPVAPASTRHQEAHRFFNLLLVRVALFDHRYRNAVRAEHDFNRLRFRKTADGFIYFFNQSTQVQAFAIETLHDVYWHLVAEQPIPFIQAASSGSRRIV